MNLFKKITLGFIILPLAACVQQRPPLDLAIIEAAHQPLICKGEKQCALYWQRSQAWVAINSVYKIQTATDTILETYNPSSGDTTLGYRLLREPQADSTARIRIAPVCMNNIRGCWPAPEQAAVNFKNYVGSDNLSYQ